jgi:hypothetical protein
MAAEYCNIGQLLTVIIIATKLDDGPTNKLQSAALLCFQSSRVDSTEDLHI